jgi:hypothetical protein
MKKLKHYYEERVLEFGYDKSFYANYNDSYFRVSFYPIEIVEYVSANLL